MWVIHCLSKWVAVNSITGYPIIIFSQVPKCSKLIFFSFPGGILTLHLEVSVSFHPLSKWTVEIIPCFVFSKFSKCNKCITIKSNDMKLLQNWLKKWMPCFSCEILMIASHICFLLESKTALQRMFLSCH